MNLTEDLTKPRICTLMYRMRRCSEHIGYLMRKEIHREPQRKRESFDQFNSTSRENTSTVVADTFSTKAEKQRHFSNNSWKRDTFYRKGWKDCLERCISYWNWWQEAWIDCNHHACKSMNLTKDLTKPSCKVHEPHRRLNEAKNLFINVQDETFSEHIG